MLQAMKDSTDDVVGKNFVSVGRNAEKCRRRSSPFTALFSLFKVTDRSRSMQTFVGYPLVEFGASNTGFLKRRRPNKTLCGPRLPAAAVKKSGNANDITVLSISSLDHVIGYETH